MQKPNSVTGQACLSSTVLTVHNILLLAGVISRIALQSLCHRYSDRDVSLFYPKIVIISCIGTAVLLVLIYVLKIMRMNTKSSLRRGFIISSHFLTSCLWYTSTRIEAQPELSTRQQQHSHHVVLQALFYKAAKTERTYKYNRTATAVVQV